VAGVAAYYTGTSKTFEVSTPFGSAGVFDNVTRKITFNGAQSLPANSTVYVFIVYTLSPVATSNHGLDLMIETGGITISGVTYRGTLPINPSPNPARTIKPPQTLGTITVVNSDTTSVKPGDTDKQILRIDFPVTNTGAPQTLQSITVTSANVSDTDVSAFRLITREHRRFSTHQCRSARPTSRSAVEQ